MKVQPLLFLCVALLAGCGSTQDYQAVPVAKLPPGAVPPGPPPPPPSGSKAGPPVNYGSSLAPAPPASPARMTGN